MGQARRKTVDPRDGVVQQRRGGLGYRSDIERRGTGTGVARRYSIAHHHVLDEIGETGSGINVRPLISVVGAMIAPSIARMA